MELGVLHGYHSYYRVLYVWSRLLLVSTNVRTNVSVEV